MVYDGAVKDQESSAGPTPSAAVSEASAAAAAEAVVSATPARPAHDKRLGVRHPLKHRRFRAGGKMMVEPGGVPSSRAVVEGEEEEASEVEEEDEEETTSAETEMPSADVEVSSAPAPVVPEVEEMEVEGGEMEAATAHGESVLEARPDEEEEVSSLVVAQGERKQEDTPTASVPALEPLNEKDEDKEREEKEKEKERERQKERERVDEVGYMSGGWKR